MSNEQNTVRFIPGDVSDPDYCEALVKAAAKTLGGLDIVVNSAGIIHHATVEETTDAQWEATLAVNVSSTAPSIVLFS